MRRRRRRSWFGVSIWVWAVGCAPVVDSARTSGSEGSSGAADAPDPSAGDDPNESTTGIGETTVGGSTSTSDGGGDAYEEDDGGTGCNFTCPTPPGGGGGGGGAIECDLFAQDCPEGEKCAAWANDGGNLWNGTRCAPLPESDPADAEGEPCRVEGSDVSGVDSCEVGAVCWDVDPDTNEGTCQRLCGVDPTEEVCPVEQVCARLGLLPVCVPRCDPLDVATCDGGRGCYPWAGGFGCVAPRPWDPSGEPRACPEHAFCEAAEACAPGDSVPGCDAEACCTSMCSLDAANECPPGTSCESFGGSGPPNAELGWCVAGS